MCHHISSTTWIFTGPHHQNESSELQPRDHGPFLQTYGKPHQAQLLSQIIIGPIDSFN